MRGTLSRRATHRIANVLIVFLSVSSLFLMDQAGFFYGLHNTWSSRQSVLPSSEQTVLSDESPVRLAIQTELGRCGVQYDMEKVDVLYGGGLDTLLSEALQSVSTLTTIQVATWEELLTESEEWVYYDFLYDHTFSSLGSQQEEAARAFLILLDGGKITALACFDGQTYFMAEATGKVSNETIEMLANVEPNGAIFSFENPDDYGQLSPQVMILPDPPSCMVYAASNPLAQMDNNTQDEFLKALAINTRAASIYESADGLVVREGTDTFRILSSGTVSYHSAGREDSRYLADSPEAGDLQARATELLNAATNGRCGQARMLCQRTTLLENGSAEILFCYLLDGACVQLGQDGWGARFVFQENCLVSFEIRFRQYQSLETISPLLPERQIAAAITPMGEEGQELLLCYQDDGGSQSAATWMLLASS